MEIETIMQELADVEEEKQKIIDRENAIKSQLVELMGKENIKKFENARIVVNYVKTFTRYSVDADLLKKKYPDVAAKCMKSSVVNPFVKVRVNS